MNTPEVPLLRHLPLLVLFALILALAAPLGPAQAAAQAQPAAQGSFYPGSVVALQGTPHLWIADEVGVLHWGGDTRALVVQSLAGRVVDWRRRLEVSATQLRSFLRGDPWLSAGLLKDGDPIYLVKWETDEGLPRLLHIQSIDDVELFGIDTTNYGQFVIDRPTWESRFGISAARLVVAELQRAVVPRPTPTAVPPPSDLMMFSDAFSDRNGTALAVHNRAWLTDGGWEIFSNQARMSTPGISGSATVDSRRLDHDVSAEITLPSDVAAYPDDWFCGLFARYLDDDNNIRARYVYQDNSPEVEVWEIVQGKGNLIEYTNLGRNALLPGSTHTLRVVVLGQTVTVYHDGTKVADTRTVLTSGTRAGIGVHDNRPFEQPRWANFQIRAVR